MSEFFELGDPFEEQTGCSRCAAMQRRLDEAQERLNQVRDMIDSLPRRDRRRWQPDLDEAVRAKEKAAAGLLNHRCQAHGQPMNEHHRAWAAA